MTTVRQIETLLGSEVEDRVLQQLGYREFSVRLPNGTLLDTDRPEVKQLDYARISEAEAAKILDITGEIINDVYDVRISRLITEDVVRTGGFWELTRDGQPTMQCLLTSVTIKDAWWRCRLVVIKTSTF